jgi:hypothetical protein
MPWIGASLEWLTGFCIFISFNAGEDLPISTANWKMQTSPFSVFYQIGLLICTKVLITTLK